jgi:hypothetical protein
MTWALAERERLKRQGISSLATRHRLAMIDAVGGNA